MIQLSKYEYIASYNEIMELINEGYQTLLDMAIAIGENLITENNSKIRTYINKESKMIDIYGGTLEKFFPAGIYCGKVYDDRLIYNLKDRDFTILD